MIGFNIVQHHANSNKIFVEVYALSCECSEKRISGFFDEFNVADEPVGRTDFFHGCCIVSALRTVGAARHRSRAGATRTPYRSGRDGRR